MRLSPQKLKILISMFCQDSTASETAELTKINRNTVNYWYKKFRNLIYLKRTKMRSNLGYPKDNKHLNLHKLVLSIYEKEKNVFIDFTPVDEYHRLIFFFRKNTDKNTNQNMNYTFLISLEYSKFISFSSKNRELKLFWIFCECRLSKFNGVSKYFDLHLKECEWRWRNDHLEEDLLSMVKEANLIK
ncbi:hypothetical protein [Acinetobacter colistiniresistens]|uniref:hypothetical protein n=1 Tax=Acinetobacter colistiniresistens TaxID=280145 RepID=UPI002FE23965